MTFCNGCGKPLAAEKYYSAKITCFLQDGATAGETHLDLCTECYVMVDKAHSKAELLEAAARKLRISNKV
jgi:hypothetical protein